MYLDRKNPSPAFEEVLEMEREEAMYVVAVKMIRKNFSDEVLAEIIELSLE